MGSKMDSISYVLAQRQMNLFKATDRIADQTANANTIGYKSQKDVFSQLVMPLENQKELTTSHISTTVRQTEQGPIETTNNPLDVAIHGKGYFQIDTNNGPKFTRAGSFQVSAQGVLVTPEGNPVLDVGGGFIEFAESDTKVTIHADGAISNQEGEIRGQLGVFTFENEQLLIAEGNNQYRTQQPAEVGFDHRIIQGTLEGSNVNSIQSMTELMDMSNKVESVKKLRDQYNSLSLNMIRTLSDIN